MSAREIASIKSELFTYHRHTGNLSEKLHMFYEYKELTDIVLIAGVDNTRVPAHRIVLASSSDYFLGMFRCPLKEATASEIVLEHMDGPTLKRVVDYIYTAVIQLTIDTIENTFRAADFFHVKPLMDNCCKFLIKQLDPFNCIGIALLADLYNKEELYKEATKYAYSNFERVFRGNEFAALSEKQLVKLLFCDSAAEISEEKIFESLIVWFEYEKVKRAYAFHRLLLRVNFALIDPMLIVDYSKLICTTIECHELIRNWLQWHLSADKWSLSTTTKSKKLYLLSPRIGGNVQLHVYDPDLNEWSFEEWPYPKGAERDCFGATVANNKLIIAGGSVQDYTTNLVECLDLETMQWNAIQGMDKPRLCPSITELNGDFYVVGGNTFTFDFRLVEKYDFDTSRWQYVAPLRRTVKNLQLVALKGRLYVTGDRLRGLECYNPNKNRWTTTALRTVYTENCSLAAVNDYIYAIGGLDSKGVPCRVIQRYNPSSNTWRIVTNLRRNYDTIHSCALNNRLIICGRMDRNPNMNYIEEYDPQTNKWKNLPTLMSFHSFKYIKPQFFSM